MKKLSVLAGVLLSCRLLGAEPASPDSQARFLAGLPAEGTPLEALEKEEGWQRHSVDLGKAWADFDKRQLARISEWMPRFAPYASEDTGTLFYFFSGPDFLYSNAFFPAATTTIMCGIEPVGALPDVAALTPAQRSAALSNLRKSLESSLNFSFFRTKAMKEDFRNTALDGTLPVLYLFIARAGCTLTSVEKIWLDPTGEVKREETPTPGVKIDFRRPGGRQQTVYYFSSDLSDYGIKTHPGFINFCTKQGTGSGLVKAASYLMHMKEFSKARDFLLKHTRTLIQDDSGIPYRFLKDAGWNMTMAGRYMAPIDLFKDRYQEDLAEAFKGQPTLALPFSAGYRWRPNESALLLARAPQAREVQPAPKALPILKALPVDEAEER